MNDVELMKAVTEFREGILDGHSSFLKCFMVCSPLQGFLSFLGIKTELIEGDFGEVNHVWLELEDGRIIDPTADQFFERWGINKMSPVYIGEKPDWYEFTTTPE